LRGATTSVRAVPVAILAAVALAIPLRAEEGDVVHFEQSGVAFDSPRDVEVTTESEPGSFLIHLDHASSFSAFIHVLGSQLTSKELFDSYQSGMVKGMEKLGLRVEKVEDGRVELCGERRPCRTLTLGPRERFDKRLWMACIETAAHRYLVSWSWAAKDGKTAEALWQRIQASLRVATDPPAPERKPAHVAEIEGIRIDLPDDWSTLDRPLNDLIQARYASAAQDLSLSLGSIVLPRTSLQEFVVAGLGALRDGVDIDAMSASLGVPREEFVRYLNEHIGPDLAGALSMLGTSMNSSLLGVESMLVDGRSAILVKTRLEYEGVRVLCRMWAIEGFSLGELVMVSIATRSEESPVPEALIHGARMRDSRVAENGIRGFRLLWPKGAFVPQGGPGSPRGRSGRVQIPLGPVGAVLVRWELQAEGDVIPIATAIQKTDSLVRNQADIHDVKDTRAREWGRGSLALGSFEYGFLAPVDAGKDAPMWSMVQMIQTPKAGSLHLILCTPQEAADVGRRVLQSVVESVQPTVDVPSGAGEQEESFWQKTRHAMLVWGLPVAGGLLLLVVVLVSRFRSRAPSRP